ncbi:hypothetical protein MXF13_21645 [Leclercia adecarboxylata]|uniref:hypothetical protein n=1 Tax=Leclercia adecarboxylata TaxID=83655 RepID=UPI002DB935A5|nr:hypothetical protein [Leclercia adecarboxylata]MEB5752469.1 hypothetical protein [Leclercia adecarboxylata]
MTLKKWLLSLIFLILAFVIMADVIVLFTYVAVKIYLYFACDISFGTSLPNFIKLLKGATFGGVIAGIGCWYIYYKNEKA